uniref:Uncharacterized protein n=1 Tax=Anguilla anguilla TaxID=7936 RepID=A0A0E9S865_ANGAN
MLKIEEYKAKSRGKMSLSQTLWRAQYLSDWRYLSLMTQKNV